MHIELNGSVDTQPTLVFLEFLENRLELASKIIYFCCISEKK